MSSKVKVFTRSLTITNDVVTGTGPYTHTLTTPTHYLQTNDVVKLSTSTAEHTNEPLTVTVVNGTSFSVSTTSKKSLVEEIVTVESFGVGMTGAQPSFTFGFSNSPSALIQVSTNTNGTVTAKVEGSVDGVKWVDAAAAQAIGANSTYMFEVTKPYVYGRLNFTVAVAGASGLVTAARTVA